MGFWNRLKADWYAKGLKGSTLGRVVVPVILENSKGARSYLDIGSGCGTLTLGLAAAGKRVTAFDSSAAMLDILDKEVKRKSLKGVKIINREWGTGTVATHDALIISNVPALVRERDGFLEEVTALAKKFVFIVESADPGADKFYYKELYPLLFGREYPKRKDYLSTYTKLHALGIFANVQVIEYNFDQPFDDMNEAIEFWKEYLGVVTAEFDEKLKTFLEKKLVIKKNGLVAPFKKRSAIIWWKQVKE